MLGHIFRAEPGHFEDTPDNRRLLHEVANDEAAWLNNDRHGNGWYARIDADGSQIWVRVRSGTIINGGRNKIAREADIEAGLNRS